MYPGGEPCEALHLVTGTEAEAVLVHPGTPLVVTGKPGRVLSDVRRDQLEHRCSLLMTTDDY